MTLANVARVLAVLVAVAAAVGSASSNQNSGAVQNQTAAGYGQHPGGSPPPPQQMEAARALGLWRSTFGAVKIEADNSRGGLSTGAVHGIWTYQRQGQWVDGYFSGSLNGNVLQFKWQEPSNPPLTGEGYLVFDPQGRQYSGRWWSDRRDRVGDWNGWRNGGGRDADPDSGQYGGQGYAQPPAPAPSGTYGPQPPPRTYY